MNKHFLCTIFGHKYSARYDSRLPESLRTLYDATASQIEAMRVRTYIGDICTRCGHLIAKAKGEQV